MSECNNALLKGLYELLEDQDIDTVLPLLISTACSTAAQGGINKATFSKYVNTIVDDAYTFFTRDESEAVH